MQIGSWLAQRKGVAPQAGGAVVQELLDIWNTREKALVDAGPGGTTLGGVLHTRPLGLHARPCCFLRYGQQSGCGLHSEQARSW